MASAGMNFESIEALWAKALALDLETDPVDLDASPSAALAAFTCLARFLSSSDRGGPLPRPLFWPSPFIAWLVLKKDATLRSPATLLALGLALALPLDLVGTWLDHESSRLWGPTESSSGLWLG